MNEDINSEILKELKSARRFNRTVWVVLGVVVLLCEIFHRRSVAPDQPWTAVQTAVKQMDFSRALIMARANIARYPNDYYGHSYIAYIYLAMGDVTNSERAYSRAYELFPNEDNE